MILKMAFKVNLRIINKNNEANPDVGFLPKSISKPNGCATAMSTAWELSTISASKNYFSAKNELMNPAKTNFMLFCKKFSIISL